MADLNELYASLETIKQEHKSVKLFFYFLNKESGLMQSGFFSIDQGKSCLISYLNKTNELALNEIPHLSFTKVTSLPAVIVDHSNAPFGTCQIDELLTRLNPANIIKKTPEPATEYLPKNEPAHSLADVTTGPAAANVPFVFYSHIAMHQDAISILEPLYGSSAAKKVEDVAKTASPHQQPVEFLNKCKQHASMMLGVKKADEIFQPLFDKLAHGRSSHH
jgi:hypothetical protein